MVIDPPTGPAAEDVGVLLATADDATDTVGDLAAAQAVQLAVRRGGPVITESARAALLRRIDDHVQVKTLP